MPFSFPGAANGYAAIATYTEENQLPLLTKLVTKPTTINNLTPITGVKYRTQMTIVSSSIVFQSASACAWNATGDVSFQGRVLEVAPIKIQTELCPRTIERYWLQTMLPLGAAEQMFEQPLAQVILEDHIARIGSQLETCIWQGATTVTGNLRFFDGFNRLTDVASAFCIPANTATVTAITSATIEQVVNLVYQNCPAAILDQPDLKIFCGWDVYRLAMQKYVDRNFFNFNPANFVKDGLGGNGFILPGTNVPIVPVQGLNGTNRLMAGCTSNLFYGVDLINDEDKIDMFYSKEFDVVKLAVYFKYGVNFAKPEEVVYFKL